TARQARSDHEPNIFFAVQGAGTSRVSQGDRQVVLRPGDMTVYDTTRPYAITNVGLTELHYFQVPRSVLALPERTLDEVLGVRISADNNPLAAVASPFLASLGHGDVLDRPRAAELVAAPAIELLRAVIAAHVDDTDLAREPLDASLALRVRRHIAAHLRDRDMSTESIAAAHHVSPRHLYNVMARDGLRLHEFIRQQRLEACRRELRDPARAHLAVATIGAHWGFVDPSHFGRVFKAAYGMTPHEWRTGDRRDQDDA
ncbi:MAG: helix-turn-helix domain-containing protein, partial [Aeromicrobium sp.]